MLCVESGLGCGGVDNKLRARTSHRLHEAVHESRHQHSIQAAATRESRPLLVPQSARHRDLALRRRRLSGTLQPFVKNVANLRVLTRRSATANRSHVGIRATKISGQGCGNNNNNNNQDDIYSAVIMTRRSLREFTRFI